MLKTDPSSLSHSPGVATKVGAFYAPLCVLDGGSNNNGAGESDLSRSPAPIRCKRRCLCRVIPVGLSNVRLVAFFLFLVMSMCALISDTHQRPVL